VPYQPLADPAPVVVPFTAMESTDRPGAQVLLSAA
jgi:hypothetical protein